MSKLRVYELAKELGKSNKEMLEMLKNKGIEAEVVAGLSLGEYSALVASEALDFETAVSLVKKRGRFMQEAVPQGIGSMVAVIGMFTTAAVILIRSC